MTLISQIKELFSNILGPNEGIVNYPIWRRKLLICLLPIACYVIILQLDKSAVFWEKRYLQDPDPACLPPYDDTHPYGWNDDELFGSADLTMPSTGWCCGIVNFPRLDDSFTTLEDMPASIEKGHCLLDEARKIITNSGNAKYAFDVWLDFFSISAASLQLVLYILAVLPCFALKTSVKFVRLGWAMKILIPIMVMFIPWSDVYPDDDPLPLYAAPLQGVTRVIANLPISLLPGGLNGTIDSLIASSGINVLNATLMNENMPDHLNAADVLPILLSQYKNILNIYTGVYQLGLKSVFSADAYAALQSIDVIDSFYVGSNVTLNLLPGWVGNVYFRSQVVQYALISIFMPSISLIPGFKAGAMLASEIVPQSPIPGWIVFICSTLYSPILLCYLLMGVQMFHSYGLWALTGIMFVNMFVVATQDVEFRLQPYETRKKMIEAEAEVGRRFFCLRETPARVVSLLWKIGSSIGMLLGLLFFFLDIPNFLINFVLEKVSAAMIINILIQYPLNMYISKMMGADFILSNLGYNVEACDVAWEAIQKGEGRKELNEFKAMFPQKQIFKSAAVSSASPITENDKKEVEMKNPVRDL